MHLLVELVSGLAWALLAIMLAKAAIFVTLSTRHWKLETGPQRGPRGACRPLVSVLVPCYNEELTLRNCVASLVTQAYPRYEIILLNDGSTDGTEALSRELAREYPRVRALTKPNGGKASALNYGIKHSTGEIIVCIDADSIFTDDTLAHLVRAFTNKRIGAVGGNVKVANRDVLIARQQGLEYICGLNLQRRAFAQLGCVQVISGAIGAFRREALEAVGGYSSDTLVEDMDITVSLIRAGYEVKYEGKALAYTESPESVKDFLAQRYRWIFGGFQVVRKHADMLFRKEFGTMGTIGLPYFMLFPWVDVLVSLLLLWTIARAVLTANSSHSLVFYLVLIVVQFSLASYALYMEREDRTLALLSAFDGLWYGLLISYTIVRAGIDFLRGSEAKWNKFARLGKNFVLPIPSLPLPILPVLAPPTFRA